jgi:hypothetical protein
LLSWSLFFVASTLFFSALSAPFAAQAPSSAD